MEFHKILVPVDFSPCSAEAFRTAVVLARQFKAELLVLHVADSRILDALGETGAQAEEVKNRFQKRAREQLRSFLSEDPSDVKIRRITATGVPFQEIVKTTRLEKAQLIVMGRSGGTGELEKIFFGSTAEKVVRLAPCAILTVPLAEEKPKSA